MDQTVGFGLSSLRTLEDYMQIGMHLLSLEGLPVLAQLICAFQGAANFQPGRKSLLSIDIIHLPPLRIAQDLCIYISTPSGIIQLQPK